MSTLSFRPPSQPMWLVLAILVLAEFNYAFEASMIYVALSKLNAIYGDPMRVGWLITAYLLFSATSAALCSRLGDKYGRRLLLLWMLGFAFVGSLLSAIAPSLEWIIVGRALQGISAAIMPLCFGLVRERLPAKSVPFGVGVIVATAPLGGAAGFILGGVIIDHFNWQFLFEVSAGMALLGLLLAWLGLKPMPVEPQPATSKGEKMDILGGVLFVPGIVSILLAITNSRSWGWLDTRTLGLLTCGVVVIGVWIRHELRHPHPLLDVRLLMRRQVALANICIALAALGAIQSTMILFPLLQQPEWTGVGLGLSATLSGTLKGALTIFGVLGASWAGYLAGRQGARRALLIGAAALAAAWGFFTIYHSSLWAFIFVNMVGSFGIGVVLSAATNLIVEATPSARSSEATGMASVFRSIFNALGAQFVAYLLASSTVSNPEMGPGRFPDDSAYTLTLVWVALTSCVCLVAGLMLPKRTQRTQPTQPHEVVAH